MIQRPLCMISAAFLIVQALGIGFGLTKAPESSVLEEQMKDGTRVVLQGTVRRWEDRPDYRLLYLEENQILPKNQDKNQINNQIIEESEILVYIEYNLSENQRTEYPKSKLKSDLPKNGNRVKVEGEISFFESARNPGNFDRKFYYQKQGIIASIWAERYEITNEEIDWMKENLAVLRKEWKGLLVRHLGESKGNIMSAVMLGDKSELDAEVKVLYQKSGIGHILAISGLHMSFIGLSFYQLLRRCGCPFWLAGGLGILFLSGYTLMIGAGVSSIRAFLMFAIRVGADICGRPYDMPTSLAFAAAVIAAGQPLYLMDAGYLLSFGAVLGMTAVCPLIAQLLKKEKKQVGKWVEEDSFIRKITVRIRKNVFKGFCGSLGVNLILLPIMLYFYFEFPPYSILLNLIIIPLMSPILGAGLAGSALCIFWDSGGGLLLQICRLLLEMYEAACNLTISLPFSRIVLGQPDKWWIVIYYLVLFSFCLFLKYFWKQEYSRKWIGMAAGAACFAAIFSLEAGRRDVFQVTMLDVGQGDGIFIRSPKGMTCFVDGGSSDVSNVGEYRITPYLESRGVSELEYVFISHGDADHINGIEEMLKQQEVGIRIRNLVLPPRRVHDENLQQLAAEAQEYGTRVVVMEQEEKISDGVMTLTCVAPSKEYQGEKGNAASMVLDLRCRGLNLLLTGDVEGEGETQLIETLLKNELLDYHILKTAHHGSKNSTRESFLEPLQISCAWISAGQENRYGHPAEETLERLEASGCRIYTTQKCGAVTLREKNGKAVIETFS